MMQVNTLRPQFVVCINNTHYPASLEQFKIYRVVFDDEQAADGDLRVIDESGEDCLYPTDCFVAIEVSEELEEALWRVARQELGNSRSQEPKLRSLNYERSGIRRVLGDLEAAIMEAVWERRLPEGVGVRVKEIHKALYLRNELAYTTVMTTMARMARKEIFRTERDPSGYVYYPNSATATSDAFHRFVLRRTLTCLLEDSGYSNTFDENEKNTLTELVRNLS